MRNLLMLIMFTTLLVFLTVLAKASQMEEVYEVMLKGEPLPTATRLVFGYVWALAVLGVFPGICSLGMLIRCPDSPITLAFTGIHWVLLVVLTLFTAAASLVPFEFITYTLTSGMP